MKRIAGLLLCVFCLFPKDVMAYGFYEFSNDVVDDTERGWQTGVKATYFYDCLESENDKNKIGASFSALSYKFISADPAIIYTPNQSSQIAEIAFSFPISIGRIPVGDGRIVRDMLPESARMMRGGERAWIDRLYVGPFMSQSISSGHFGFGLNIGFQFF